MSLFVSFGTVEHPLPSLRTTDPGAGIGTLLNNVISLTTYAAGIAFLGYLIYGGIMWITAAGNEDRVDRAQKAISNALIGLVVVVAAIIVTQIVGAMLGFDNILTPVFEGPSGTGTS
ncbi:MAG: hypothetical protein U9M98_00640 [Patescibacteria group bacterium]|nr:hypothetical protein [Patescibacteria group bacterium]